MSAGRRAVFEGKVAIHQYIFHTDGQLMYIRKSRMIGDGRRGKYHDRHNSPASETQGRDATGLGPENLTADERLPASEIGSFAYVLSRRRAKFP